MFVAFIALHPGVLRLIFSLALKTNILPKNTYRCQSRKFVWLEVNRFYAIQTIKSSIVYFSEFVWA